MIVIGLLILSATNNYQYLGSLYIKEINADLFYPTTNHQTPVTSDMNVSEGNQWYTKENQWYTLIHVCIYFAL